MSSLDAQPPEADTAQGRAWSSITAHRTPYHPNEDPSSPPLAPKTALTLQCHGSVAQAMWGHQDGDTEMGDGEIMGIAG